MADVELQQVILHLGAHKTASTHFSEVILANPDLARACDVAIPRKGPLREAVTSQLSSLKDNQPVPAELREAALALGGGHKGLLGMDENILGTPKNLFVDGQMYPRAARRVGRAVRLFEGVPVTIMLALRDPATFVASSWSESLRSNEFKSFKNYLDGATAQSISWLKIVSDLREAAPEAKVVLWRFEDYRSLLPELIARALMQDPATKLDYRDITEPVRVGMSDKALKAIKAEGRETGEVPSAERVDEIMAQFPKSKDAPAPKPWKAPERVFLTEKYAEEVASLRADPTLTFLHA